MTYKRFLRVLPLHDRSITRIEISEKLLWTLAFLVTARIVPAPAAVGVVGVLGALEGHAHGHRFKA